MCDQVMFEIKGMQISNPERLSTYFWKGLCKAKSQELCLQFVSQAQGRNAKENTRRSGALQVMEYLQTRKNVFAFVDYFRWG